MSQPDSLREAALNIVERELGKPYIWGGDDPISGWDCSGIVIEALKATGRLPRNGDWRAADLAAMFPKVTVPSRGDLVFWNRGGKIGHVEMIWAIYGPGNLFTIGASGGGSGTMTREDAIKQNAYVRIRPIEPGWIMAVDPF